MNKEITSLPDDPLALKQIIAQLQARNMFLEEQFRLAQQKHENAKCLKR